MIMCVRASVCINMYIPHKNKYTPLHPHAHSHTNLQDLSRRICISTYNIMHV